MHCHPMLIIPMQWKIILRFQQQNNLQCGGWLLKVFGVVPMNMRLSNHLVTEIYTEEQIGFYANMLLLNKYRESFPYIPSTPTLNKQMYPISIDQTKLDPDLIKADYNTLDGLSMIFKRHFGVFFLEWHNDHYSCDLTNYKAETGQLHSNFFPHTGVVKLDANLNILSMNFNDGNGDVDLSNASEVAMACKRINASMLTLFHGQFTLV